MKTKSIKKPRSLSFSIKAKVAILCTCSILLAVTVNFLFMFNSSKNAIQSNTEVTLQNLADSYSNNLSDVVNQISHSTNFLMMSSSATTDFVNSGGTKSSKEVEELVASFLSSNTYYEDVSLVDSKGVVLYSSNSNLVGKDLSNEVYFTEMVSSGLSTQSNVYLSKTSGEACVTFASPLRTDMNPPGMVTAEVTSEDSTVSTSGTTGEDSNVNSTASGTNPAIPGMGGQETAVEEFTGAIVSTIKVSAFSNSFTDITVGGFKTGYSFILDPTGTVIYHPNASLIGTKLDISEFNQIISQIENGTTPESDTITYKYNNIIKYASYSIDSGNHWITFITTNQAEVMDSINIVAKNTLLISILLILILSLIAYVFTGSITKSIKKITQLINKTAELDFSEDKTFSSLSLRRDETGEMSRAIEKMRGVLNSIILHISDVSGKLIESSEGLNSISYSVNDNASDNSATAEELSASMQETAATTEQIYSSIEQIGINSKDITEKVSLGAKLSSDLINRAEELKTTTNNATAKTQKIYEEVKAKTDAAIEQSKAVNNIHILTKTIKDIASQTSLLALNASIEAARAGDAGNGFTVVATEIGSLASQSTRTVSHITEVVEEVYQAVENMTKSLEQTLNFLGNNVLTDYNTFLNNSEKYNTDAGIMNEAMESIQNQIDQLNSNVLGISDSISEINMMVNEASKGVNDVAERNTDIVALTSSTEAKAKENTEYANGLKEIVQKFKL